MNFPKWTLLLLLVILPGMVTGCSEAGPKRYDVSGTASFDGMAIERGGSASRRLIASNRLRAV